MSSENLAIVFAPSLMSSSYTDPLSCLAGAKFEQAVVNQLIMDFGTIFDGEDSLPDAPFSSSASTTTSRSTTASSRWRHLTSCTVILLLRLPHLIDRISSTRMRY